MPKKSYDSNFRLEALKLAKEIGSPQAALKLGIPQGTLDAWVSRARKKLIEDAETNAVEVLQLKDRIFQLEQENKQLWEVNQMLAKAVSFFSENFKNH